MVHSPPCRPILVQRRARANAMWARVAVVNVGGSGNDAIIAAAINRANVNDAAIGAVSSITPSLLSTMTSIAATNDHHCRCHTVNNNNRQKPAVLVCCRQWQ